MEVTLKNVRISFPNLFEPKSVQDSEPRYSANFLLAPDHPSVAAVRAALTAVAAEKWGKKGPDVLASLDKRDRVCLHDGSDKAKYEGYDGMLYVSAARQTKDGRPLVVDRDKSPLTPEDGKPYSGCYVNASIDVWAQDNAYGQRINATLRWVQFVKDGDAFGGGSRASVSEIEDLGVEDANDVSDLA